MDYRTILTDFQKAHDFFVGIDSDGCVFPTMDIKQKDCFHPLLIKHWGLKAIEKELRETAEFVNLHSVWRGTNRFIALARTFDLLRSRKDIQGKGVEVGELTALKKFNSTCQSPNNSALSEAVSRSGDPELIKVLEWSLEVNDTVERKVKNIPPFRRVVECLDKLQSSCDIIVVSQTPLEALEREWKENNIREYAKLIAGQEMGTKVDHISLTAKGRYPDDRIILIGDALGDLKTAESLGIAFFPINPGMEEQSWQELLDIGIGRFIDGSFTGSYQASLTSEFRKLLPDKPKWERE